MSGEELAEEICKVEIRDVDGAGRGVEDRIQSTLLVFDSLVVRTEPPGLLSVEPHALHAH